MEVVGQTGARTLCRLISLGAIVTGVVMVIFTGDVAATNQSGVVDSIVHLSNVKFMAAMWCAIGVLFWVGAPQLHDAAAWRLLRVACIGISASAVVRLVEMVRFDRFAVYATVAALLELVVPPAVIYLRRCAYGGDDQ